jgi:hypothetical protein
MGLYAEQVLPRFQDKVMDRTKERPLWLPCVSSSIRPPAVSEQERSRGFKSPANEMGLLPLIPMP